MLIIYGEDGSGSGLDKDKYLQKIANRISNIVHKYYLAYRQEVINQQNSKEKNINFNDYSHPLKIYSTLVSILMLLDSMQPLLEQNSLKLAYQAYEVKELVSWQEVGAILDSKWVK